MKKYTGIIPPLITPLTSDGALDKPAVARLVEHCISGGVTGVFPNGSSGEAMRVCDDVWEENTREVLKLAKGRVDVFCGAIDSSASRVVTKIRKIEDMGGELAVCCAPFYLRSFGQDEILRHFDYICSRTRLNICVYNIPEMTQVCILPETISRLAEYDNIVVCKDSSADWQHFQRVLFLCKDKEISILNGAEELCAAAMLYGADGCIPGLADFMPKLFVDLYEACKRGDIAESYNLQKTIYEVRKTIFLNGCWMSGMKCLSKIFAIGGDGLSSGLLPFTPAQEAMAVDILRDNGICLPADSEVAACFA